MTDQTSELEEPVSASACPDCGREFASKQGLAGHRRLAHSASTRSALEEREAKIAQREDALKRREVEVARQAATTQRRDSESARREREIADTGPAALGLSQCSECHAWFDTTEDRGAHVRTVHRVEDAVAEEVGRSRDRVLHEWTEAVRKQNANPDKSAEWVVDQFWWPTDKRILRALLAKNATFRGDEE